MRFRFVVFCVLLAALLALPRPARATASLTLEATFTTVSYGWARVERWKDNGALFQAEQYLADGRNDQDGQRKTFFATGRPHASRFLLYHAPGWDSGSQPTPVLLVHGANDTADRAWAAPNLNNCGATSCPATGLMQYLAGRGYKVFAINFPHKHGDNYYWAEQIHDAINIIKSKTGASQVDVIGWSKGGFAARQYVSSAYKSGGSAYNGGVRKLILLGTPNKGIDYTFRHGILPSIGSYPECGVAINTPGAHTELVCYGIWYSHPELSIYTTGSGNYFPGQKQMLARWDGVYGLPATEQDWYTSYYGGLGYVSNSLGIEHAMAGSLVGTIRAKGIPAGIKTYLYCGGANDIPNIHNEHTGPSDGVVFTASCGDTVGIGTLSQKVTNSAVNHLELAWESGVASQIDAWLTQ
jgi:hypothetical protein